VIKERFCDHPAGWTQTYTGRIVYPLALQPEDVCIEDIAGALSRHCRFNGHCRTFYSVAQHSIWCKQRMEDLGSEPHASMAALLHDAPEYVLPDLCAPIKWAFGIAGDNGYQSFEDVERRVLNAIAKGLRQSTLSRIACDDTILHKLIKHVDLEALATERRDLMSECRREWGPMPAPVGPTLRAWSPPEAEERFLEAYSQLVTAQRKLG
jgi:hypothetical protein